MLQHLHTFFMIFVLGSYHIHHWGWIASPWLDLTALSNSHVPPVLVAFVKMRVLPIDFSNQFFLCFHSTTCGEVSRSPCGLWWSARQDCDGRNAYKLTRNPKKWFLSSFPSEHLDSSIVFLFVVVTGRYRLTLEEQHIGRSRNESIVLSLTARKEYFESGLKDSQNDSILSARAVRWSFWCWPFCSPVVSLWIPGTGATGFTETSIEWVSSWPDNLRLGRWCHFQRGQSWEPKRTPPPNATPWYGIINHHCPLIGPY